MGKKSRYDTDEDLIPLINSYISDHPGRIIRFAELTEYAKNIDLKFSEITYFVFSRNNPEIRRIIDDYNARLESEKFEVVSEVSEISEVSVNATDLYNKSNDEINLKVSKINSSFNYYFNQIQYLRGKLRAKQKTIKKLKEMNQGLEDNNKEQHEKIMRKDEEINKLKEKLGRQIRVNSCCKKIIEENLNQDYLMQLVSSGFYGEENYVDSVSNAEITLEDATKVEIARSISAEEADLEEKLRGLLNE